MDTLWADTQEVKSVIQAIGMGETMPERQISPVFQDDVQRIIFRYRRQPPIEFPVTEGEIENFPRHFNPMMIERIKKDFKKRRRWYGELISQIARNSRRPGRGEHVFIILPTTAEKLLTELKRGPGHQQAEAERVIWEMYHRGLTPDEAECQINRRTLIRHLQRAEKIVDVLGELRDNPLRIGLTTVRISYAVLRYGRDAMIDIQKYFRGRIF